MRFTLKPTSARLPETPTASSALINDWAGRVTDLSEDALDHSIPQNQSTEQLEDACLVRDELNNQLELTHPDASAPTERSFHVLKSADALFRRITVESNTADTLSIHNHYPRRSEWWWRRLLRRPK